MANTYLDGQGLFVDPDAMTGKRNMIVTDAATRTLTDSEAFSVVVATKGSATQTFTLPIAADVEGAEFTFICGSAAGEILVDPNDADDIKGMTFAAIGADADTGNLAPADNTGIKNTAATNVLGDNITLISDGITTWYIKGMPTGIWATQ